MTITFKDFCEYALVFTGDNSNEKPILSYADDMIYVSSSMNVPHIVVDFDGNKFAVKNNRLVKTGKVRGFVGICHSELANA